MVAGLGDSDVALRENILKKPVEFVKTWIEWSAINRQQILRSNSIIGDTTIFTVPKGFDLFITSATASISGPGGQAVFLEIRDGSNFITRLIGVFSQGVNGGVLSNSVTFPMPVKVESGQNLFHNGVSLGSLFEFTSFAGWLEPKSAG